MNNSYQEFDALPEGWSPGKFVDGKTVGAGPGPLWSGNEAPPAIGATVKVTMNGLGPAIVKGYFAEEGWLGVLVELQMPPEWWLKQNEKALENGKRLSHIFGTEMKSA